MNFIISNILNQYFVLFGIMLIFTFFRQYVFLNNKLINKYSFRFTLINDNYIIFTFSLFMHNFSLKWFFSKYSIISINFIIMFFKVFVPIF